MLVMYRVHRERVSQSLHLVVASTVRRVRSGDVDGVWDL